MKKLLFLFLLFNTTIALTAQTQAAHNLLQSGDMAYDAAQFNSAENEYRKSINEGASSQAQYNMGNAIYRQGQRNEEAINAFQKAANQATDPMVKASAYHNMGNALMQQQDLKAAIESYKNALRNNPNDVGSKLNLAKAMQALRQQQQQEQQQQDQQNEDENQEQQDQQNQDNQENQGQQNQDQQQQQDQQNPNSDQQQQDKEGNEQEDEQQQSQQQQSQEGDGEADETKMNAQQLSKEEALRLLQVMEAEEQKVLEKMRRAKSNGKKSDKDW